MASNTDVVFYEDLVTTKTVESTVPPPSSSPAQSDASVNSPGPSPAKLAKVSTSKRQRTLFEMVPKSNEEGAGPANKKTKFSSSSLSSLPKLNSIPFSMSKYLESLNEEEKQYLRLECETMGKSWLKVLKDEIRKPYFLALKKFLWKEGVRGPDDLSQNTCPPSRDIYAWSNVTPLGKIKVVIIGQDPYHGRGQAHGLSFSVPKGITVPPSLKNIYKELKSEYPEFNPPQHGNLVEWARNGVLMLNTSLTVHTSQAGSHKGKGWEHFTDKVVEIVDKYGGANLSTGHTADTPGVGRGVVFVAWGRWAEKRVGKLSKTKHLILTSGHPSPYSEALFFGNGHFKAANEWLEKKYGPSGTVDWLTLDKADSV